VAESNARWLYYSQAEALLRADYLVLADTLGSLPGLTPIFYSSDPPAVLYRTDASLGRRPDWIDDPIRRNLRAARAQLIAHPDDVEALYVVSAMELVLGNRAAAHEAIAHASSLDVRGIPVLKAIAAGDSALAAQLLMTLLSKRLHTHDR